MKTLFRNFLILGLMLAASGLALALRPTQRIAANSSAVDLQRMFPDAFGGWRNEPEAAPLVVDPRQKKVIDRIYKQTLSRTYVGPQGYRIMLSIAYGDDQRDAVQLHYTEVCYPAQGFQILSNQRDILNFPNGTIPVRRLVATFGLQRTEPITYWTMIGDQAVLGGVDKKLAEMQFGLNGQIPDGLLFRISSIDSDSKRAFELQKEFVEDLVGALEPDARRRVTGLH